MEHVAGFLFRHFFARTVLSVHSWENKLIVEIELEVEIELQERSHNVSD